MTRMAIVVFSLALVGCAPVAGTFGAWMFALGALLLASAAACAGATAPPPRCEGPTHTWCQDRRVHQKCYPKNTKVNFAYQPYIGCGYGACVPGNDPSQCTQRTPSLDGRPQSECHHSSWQKACVEGKVTEACIMQVPTNYTGPPTNPRFITCNTPLGEQCVIHAAAEACHPTRAQMGNRKCETHQAFRKVCIDTHISERCLPDPPTNFSGVFWQNTVFADCGDNRCAPAQAQCPK